jgi:hypothetical protein
MLVIPMQEAADASGSLSATKATASLTALTPPLISYRRTQESPNALRVNSLGPNGVPAFLEVNLHWGIMNVSLIRNLVHTLHLRGHVADRFIKRRTVRVFDQMQHRS